MTEADNSTEAGPTDDRPTWKRALNVAGVFLLVAAVVPFVAYAVPAGVGAEHSYVVLSGSMEPTMSPGDVIFVEDVPTSAIEEGDVITFESSGEAEPTTHRVVDVVEREDGRAFRTKGDNNEDPDRELVEPPEVEGRLLSVAGVPLVVPYIGYVIQFAATQTGFALLVVGPLGLLVASEVWDVVASTRSASGDEGESRPDSGGGSPATDGDAAGPATHDGAEDGVTGPTGGPDSEGEDEGLTLRTVELRLGVAILATFLVYSVVVAYVTTEPWTVGVAASVAVAFALLAGLYLFGGDGDDRGAPDAGSEGDGGDPADPSPTGDDGATTTSGEGSSGDTVPDAGGGTTDAPTDGDPGPTAGETPTAEPTGSPSVPDATGEDGQAPTDPAPGDPGEIADGEETEDAADRAGGVTDD